jgi:sigma-B regulation protein RsbU (phosphoserine phosphatase)
VGAVIEHNTAFFRLMGFRDAHGVTLSEDALVGRELVDLVGAKLPGFAAYLRAPQGDLRIRVGEIEVKASPIELPSRERIGTFVLVRDITEEAQIEQRDAIIRRDLTQARAFQQMILSEPPTVPSHDIDVVYRPVEQVGGDVYDVSILPNHKLRMFIADATGHGVTAALVTMLIKSSYDQVRTIAAPNEMLAQLNDRVAKTARTLDAMFTAAVVDVDLAAQRLVHSSAAHLPPVLVNGAGVVELESGGTFMGVSTGRVYPTWSRSLPPDAALYLMTDGIAEARRTNGEQFGEDRFFRALVEAAPLPHGAGDAVLARLDAWLRPALPDDDITIIGLRPRAN